MIAQVVDGVADGAVIHQPAAEITSGWTPYSAVSRCGLEGVVYVKAGLFAAAAECIECAVAEEKTRCGKYGSVNRYNEGCRCADCRRANKTYKQRKYRERRTPPRICPICEGLKSPEATMCMGCRRERAACAHGSDSLYARGCRCDLCIHAHAEYQRKYRARQKAQLRQAA